MISPVCLPHLQAQLTAKMEDVAATALRLRHATVTFNTAYEAQQAVVHLGAWE